MSNPEMPDRQDQRDDGRETRGAEGAETAVPAGSDSWVSDREPDDGRRRDERRSRWVAVILGLAVVALGPLLGWIWAAVAPRLAVIKVDGGFLYAESEPEQPVAADGWFAIIGAVTGVLVAALAWRLLRKHRGVAMLVGLTVSSLAAAALAWYVGSKIGYAQFARARDAAAVGDRLNAPLELAMTDLNPKELWRLFPTGVAAVQALFAAFTYTFLAGFSPYPNLREGTRQPAGDPDPDQFGPGFTGSSESATGTART